MKTFSINEAVKELGLNTSKFYLLRNAGIIPGPQTGRFTRRRYSEHEISDIKRKLEQEGITSNREAAQDATQDAAGTPTAG